MWYIPGSHRWGLLEKTGLAGDMDAVRDVLTPQQIADFDRKIPVEMKAGEASFHHPVLMHGSYANRSERGRRATLINVFADGVCSNIDPETQPLHGSYPHVPPGEKMGGDYYPLLVDPEERFGALAGSIPTVDSI